MRLYLTITPLLPHKFLEDSRSHALRGNADQDALRSERRA